MCTELKLCCVFYSTDLDGLSIPQLLSVKLSNGKDYTFTLTEVLHSILHLCPASFPSWPTVRPTVTTTPTPTPMTTTSSEHQTSPTPTTPTSAASTRASTTASPPSTPSPPHTTSATTEAQAGPSSSSVLSSPDFKMACLDYLAEVSSSDGGVEKGVS